MSKLIRKFENCQVETYVYEIDNKQKVLKCCLDGVEYGFNVGCIPEKNLEWFAEVYSRQLAELHKNTRRKTLEEGKNLIKAVHNFFELSK